jgi:hypothetical protein
LSRSRAGPSASKRITELEQEIDRLQRTEEAIVATSVPRERGCHPSRFSGSLIPNSFLDGPSMPALRLRVPSVDPMRAAGVQRFNSF